MARPYRVLANVDHGKVRTYRKGCRCASCTAAATAAVMRWRRETAEKTPRHKIPHNTVGGYTNYGCRCPECTEAMTASKRSKRRGSATGGVS